ncbi:hypothetical protein CC78DRAFT_584299 [Lojkania enalia]|uniref:Uncharacterized protein n=1 Tax=Lojkania enalia TaxID=147567 RepID=A0A9P4K1K1_9PLEO|nr:hypothetical protein CC78DRAFT_584299 [Didymosphaeria enalia]
MATPGTNTNESPDSRHSLIVDPAAWFSVSVDNFIGSNNHCTGSNLLVKPRRLPWTLLFAAVMIVTLLAGGRVD